MQMIIPKQMAFQSRARLYHRAEKLSCQKIESEHDDSIDEQIIPTKTRYRRIRKYNLKKTRRNGESRIWFVQEKVV